MVHEGKQIAGYETLIAILLLMFWLIYKYWKSAKSAGFEEFGEEDENLTEEVIAADDSIQNIVLTTDNAEGVDPSMAKGPIASTLRDLSSKPQQEIDTEENDLKEFDPRKAVIWAEIIKRPYC
ncbi:MAG: hypothetical protein WCO63_04965 [Bacteroidota bacterium]